MATAKTTPKTTTPKKKAAAPKKPSAKKTAPSAAPKVTKEEIHVAANQLVTRISKLIKEGNVRRIRIKHKGKTMLEMPVTLATIGMVVAPYLAFVGALAALITECTLEIERVDGDKSGK